MAQKRTRFVIESLCPSLVRLSSTFHLPLKKAAGDETKNRHSWHPSDLTTLLNMTQYAGLLHLSRFNRKYILF